ncbi:MAG: nucleotidyl transferase AbiEii/AbiGii toxin family protein [Thiomicrospira sp.]|nr:nucleotidyl transferase AbiEii/AbiGii toxin family protein [Thiomicrospira sp.]
MNPNNPYFKQVQLLVSVLPILQEHPVFALKGGTAINLFVRDLPRLSVDIDLAYQPIKGREESVKDIHEHLFAIASTLRLQGLRVQPNHPEQITRLAVANDQAQIKIETSPVLRGTVHPAVTLPVRHLVEQWFGYVEVQTLSFEDLYAGKLCAALDRQHPRDLFDVKVLFENEGVSIKLKDTFMAYLISHPRPISELLNPNLLDIAVVYQREFEHMTVEKAPLVDLLVVRETLIERLLCMLTDRDKAFLLSVKKGKPDWQLFAYPRIAELPAIKWKLHNLAKMNLNAHQQACYKLEKLLNSI